MPNVQIKYYINGFLTIKGIYVSAKHESEHMYLPSCKAGYDGKHML